MSIKKIFLLSLLFCLCSCSAVEKIQHSSNQVRALAQDSKLNFEKIHEAASAEPPRIEEIQERSNQGISEQTEIITKTEGIITATSKVIDVIPWWVNLIEIVAIAVGVIVTVGFMWYAGLGTLLRKLIGFVPESKNQEAKMLDEAIKGDKTSLREVVALLRAKDADLDRAFKKRKKNAKL